MNKQDIQHQIRWQETRDTASTNRWLSSCGIDEMSFATTHALHLHAQRAATRILGTHRQHMQLELLASKHQHTLEQYLASMQHKRKRARLSDKQAYQVLNICTRANKQLFKQHRNSKH